MECSHRHGLAARLFRLGTLLLFVFVHSPQVLSAQTVAQLQQRGIIYFQRGQLKEALAEFSKVIQIDSKNAVAYTSRGLVRYKLGDIEGAVNDHNKAIELDPNLPEAYTNRGGARFALGDSEGALADHSKSIELNPQNVEAYNNRGLVRLARGDVDGSIKDFNKALRLDPFYPRGAKTYTNRATARLQKATTLKGDALIHELRGAIEDSTRALVIDPKLAQAHNIRGLTYMKTVELDPPEALKLGVDEKALVDFTSAIRIDPELALAYLNRGILQVKRRQFTPALEDLRKAVKLAPRLQDSATPWIQWAESKQGQSSSDQAPK